MRLTLIKAGTYPNPDADLGNHQFTYSIFPHSGTWKEAGTQKMAYNLNAPMYGIAEDAHNGILPASLSLIMADKENCIIEAVKKAENKNSVIVRLYEYMNRRDIVKLITAKQIACVWECDLMENKIESIKDDGNSFSFEIKPYEIKTFMIDFV